MYVNSINKNKIIPVNYNNFSRNKNKIRVNASNKFSLRNFPDYGFYSSTSVLVNLDRKVINFGKKQETISVDEQAKMFMELVGSSFSDKKKSFIVVMHVIKNSTPLIMSLSKYGRIAGIIAKPNSIENNVYEGLQKKGINFLDIGKEDLKGREIINKKIVPLIRENEDLLIVDIGGYFAPSLEQLNDIKGLIGIVEDTENGLQKYEKALIKNPHNKVPIYSIARSYLKDFEDYLIGRSIAISTLYVLQSNKINYQNKNIGIIGFGEVGRGAALYLRDYKNCNVKIYDKDENVQNLAKNTGFNTASREEIIKNSDILICCTGNKSLIDEDILEIKQDCYISSCTSSDDEFDFKKYNINEGEFVGKLLRKNQKAIFINDGNAVNFSKKGLNNFLLSPYIFLTCSGIINCCTKLDNDDINTLSEVNVLSSQEEKQLISAFHDFMKPNNENAEFIKKIIESNLGRKE